MRNYVKSAWHGFVKQGIAAWTLRYVFAFTVPPKGLAGFHLMFHNKTPGASFRIVRAELR